MSLRQLGILVLPFVLLIVLGLILMIGDSEHMRDADDLRVDDLEILTIATGTTSEEELMERFEPFLQFVNERLHHRGIEIEPVLFNTKAELNKAIDAGQVDLYLESPFPVYCAVMQRGMRPIARQWKNGVENYHSVVLAKCSSNLSNLRDLAGKVIALEDSTSSSSYGLPVTALMSAGFTPRESVEGGRPIAKDEIGYRFSRTDSVSIRWLLDGTVDAAAVNSVYYEEISSDIGAALTVIHETQRIPRYLLAVRRDLPEATEQVILDMLLALETYPEGRAAMASLWNTKRFDLIPYEHDLRERMFAMIDLMSCDP